MNVNLRNVYHLPLQPFLLSLLLPFDHTASLLQPWITEGVVFGFEYQQVLPYKKKMEKTVTSHFHPSYSTFKKMFCFCT